MSARCRTRRCPTAAPRLGSRTSSERSPNRSTSRPKCCSTGNAACCARDAPDSPSRSPATRSSNCSNAVHCNRWASRPVSRSSRTTPETPCRSARSARSPARPTGSVPGRSTWCPAPACANTAQAGARSARITAAERSCAGWPVMTRRSTRNGTATRDVGHSPTRPRVTASPLPWSARTASCAPPHGRRPSTWRVPDSPPHAVTPGCSSADG